MVLLVAKISKLYCKLENHLHPGHEAEALQAFESDVSICLNQLSNSELESEVLCFSWIQKSFGLLKVINKAFAKLVVDIDYPMSKWETASVEEYLNYSLCLLELLNSISSSVSHLGQARLALSHALGMVESSPSLAVERMTTIQTKKERSSQDFKEPEAKEAGEERLLSNKERAIHQAVMALKRIGFWVCGVILAGLSGDAKPYLDLRKPRGSSNSALTSLDARICEVIEKKGGALKEVRELNDSTACLAAAVEGGESSGAAEDLQRRLVEFEKLLENLGKEVDHLFSKLLAGRNELLDGIRQKM